MTYKVSNIVWPSGCKLASLLYVDLNIQGEPDTAKVSRSLFTHLSALGAEPQYFDYRPA